MPGVMETVSCWLEPPNNAGEYEFRVKLKDNQRSFGEVSLVVIVYGDVEAVLLQTVVQQEFSRADILVGASLQFVPATGVITDGV